MKNIRNFCIIAHIDHGKSTLADRMLEITGTVENRKMHSQYLDTMDLERERGITIKLQPVRMNYSLNAIPYTLNLIDTPGHVDFSYEVSRSLAAVEGAILLVDATQGIQAQTIANLHLALEQNLEIIPVINKIDLPAARADEVKQDIVHLLGGSVEDILCVSAKTGEGVKELLDVVVKRIPPPASPPSPGSPAEKQYLRALIFDSHFDDYQGVVAHIRVVDGAIRKKDPILFMATKQTGEVLDTGVFKPQATPVDVLNAGEIGYVVTGFKDIGAVRVGDTITTKLQTTNYKLPTTPLPGYKKVQSMVFAGFFPKEGDSAEELRDALGKIALNDASLVYEPEHSAALGFGFRCGFLGLLHLDIIQERLRREHDLNLIITAPTVAYELERTDGSTRTMKAPQDLPDRSVIAEIREPIVSLTVVSTSQSIGGIMAVVERHHGIYRNTEYLQGERVLLSYELPLASILVDFYDQIKSVSQGYASMNYEFLRYQSASVVRMDVLVAEELVEPFAMLVYEDEASRVGRGVVERLKEALPRQMFEVKLQAAVGSHIVASERISAMKKDVLAKMSGGDYTRKRKLLEKQKKGKKKMRSMGSVDIPANVYLEVFKHGS